MTWGIYVTAGIAGLLTGAFLNVVIHRGPQIWGLIDSAPARGGLAWPRSYCPSCRTPIAYWRLVPVWSFLAQGGRCAACTARISLRYPIVELLGAGVAVAAVWRFGGSVEAILGSLFGWTLIALAGIDAEEGYLPDALTFPLIASGIAVNTVDLFAPAPAAIIGALSGYGAFRLIGAGFSRWRGKEGLGRGDAKLLSAVGAWAGWQALPAVVLIAAVSTLGFALLEKHAGKQIAGDTIVRFGPGLSAAAFMVFLFGTNT